MKTSNVIAKKKLGQNFLVDQKTIQQIVDAVFEKSKKHYFEIGPGTGALSIPVSKLTNDLTVIEIDDELVFRLKPWLNKNVKIVNQDILKFNWGVNLFDNSVVFGNLPYYITTEIIEKIFENSNKIDYAVIMIQHDVANKIIKNKLGKEMTYLGLLVNYIFSPIVVSQVSKNNFIPKPNVDSTVLKLTTLNKYDPKYLLDFRVALVELLKQRRKTLNNNLKEMNVTVETVLRITKLVPSLGVRLETLAPAVIYSIVEEIVKG